jgi:hypothetical protein
MKTTKVHYEVAATVCGDVDYWIVRRATLANARKTMKAWNDRSGNITNVKFREVKVSTVVGKWRTK